MPDFHVFPTKSELTSDAVRLAVHELDFNDRPHQAQELVTGLVEVLWPHTPGLTARSVVDVLSNPESFQAALDAHEEQASYISMWSAVLRESPGHRLDASRLPSKLQA